MRRVLREHAQSATAGVIRLAIDVRPLGRFGWAERWAASRVSLASGRIACVITEQAVLDVRPGQERDFESAFRDVDVICSPASPTPAFRLGEKVNDPLAMYLSDIYTIT